MNVLIFCLRRVLSLLGGNFIYRKLTFHKFLIIYIELCKRWLLLLYDKLKYLDSKVFVMSFADSVFGILPSVPSSIFFKAV